MKPDSADPGAEIAEVFRTVSGQAVATLIRWCGDISVAEDAVQDAFEVAMDRWAANGIPPNPAGWIVTTARRRGIDQLRRTQRGRELELEVQDDRSADDGDMSAESPGDDRLRLIFTCCHPSIRPEHQVALTLRLLGGLDVAEIASSFLVGEAAMARRIGRAKYKIAAANIPYRVPATADLPERLASVMAVLYLIYNAGTDDLVAGTALRHEAIRLTRGVVSLMPVADEAAGLLGLLLLNESRVPARMTNGEVVLLRDQERTLWNHSLIAEGHQIVRGCIARNRPGPFQLQAAIQAVHCHASSFAETDWAQIIELYDHLFRITRSPVVALNRAIARGEVDGPVVALGQLDELGGDLANYAFWHAARAAALRELSRTVEAVGAFRSAEMFATSERDRSFFADQANGLEDQPSA